MKLAEIIGQEKIKESLGIILESVRKNGDVCPGILLEGFSGGGKSTFARAIAGELNHRFTEVNCGCLKSNTESQLKLMTALESLQRGDILFLDETHSLPKPLQEILYTAIEEGYISFGDAVFGCKTMVQQFTLIGATTHLGALTVPMQGRFKYVFRIAEYESNDIATILQGEATKLNISIDCSALAKYCRGNPRQAKNYLDWIYRYCHSKGCSGNESTIKAAMQQRGIYPYGLTEHDIKYLRALAERKIEGVRALSNRINVEEGTVKKNIEPYLLKLGLISILPSMQGKRGINLDKVRELGIL